VTPEPTKPEFLRTWLFWTLGFLAFPLSGLLAIAVVDRVDDPLSALIGGTVTGLGIGTGQALASRHRLDLRRWVPATAVGMGLGLLLGAALVSYGTSLGDLALMGAVNGAVLGVAQTLALPRRTQARWAWTAAMPALWALGWTVTTVSGVSVDDQFTVFGAAGCLTFSAVSGLLLHRLLPYHPAPGPTPNLTPTEVTA
jgi:hypothetical protein